MTLSLTSGNFASSSRCILRTVDGPLTACCLFVRSFVCLFVCVHLLRLNAGIRNNNTIKQRNSFESPLPLPPQGRDPEVSGLYEIPVNAKWLRTRVSKASIRMLTQTATQIDAKQYTNMHRFVCLRGFGSYFLCSLSARRGILAVVRAGIRIPNPTHPPCIIKYKS